MFLVILGGRLYYIYFGVDKIKYLVGVNCFGMVYVRNVICFVFFMKFLVNLELFINIL